MKNTTITEKTSKESVVESMKPFVMSIVNRLYNSKISPVTSKEDLMSAGILGLLEALESYEPSRDNKFSTFAYYRVHGSIVDYLRLVDNLPIKTRRVLNKTSKAKISLEQKLGRTPTDSEVVSEIGIDMGRWERILKKAEFRRELYLGNKVGGEDCGTYYDMIEDEKLKSPEVNYQIKNLRGLIFKYRKVLSPKELEVINLYYFSDEQYNQEEISDIMGLTQSRISQLTTSAFNKLRPKLKYLRKGYDYA